MTNYVQIVTQRKGGEQVEVFEMPAKKIAQLRQMKITNGFKGNAAAFIRNHGTPIVPCVEIKLVQNPS